MNTTAHSEIEELRLTKNENENINDELDLLYQSLNKQDFKQKKGMYIAFLLEFYRVLMGSFLLIVVPQNCGGDICSFNDIIFTIDPYRNTVLYFNALTSLLFVYMYYVELKRENALIDYLEVNPALPRDNSSVGDALIKLSQEHKNEILNLDKMYKHSGLIAISGFSINTILSAITILTHILDNTTITVLVTNILFMSSKLSDIYTITNTKENIFLSAYLIRKIQYNDVDPDYIITVESDI